MTNCESLYIITSSIPTFWASYDQRSLVRRWKRCVLILAHPHCPNFGRLYQIHREIQVHDEFDEEFFSCFTPLTSVYWCSMTVKEEIRWRRAKMFESMQVVIEKSILCFIFLETCQEINEKVMRIRMNFSIPIAGFTIFSEMCTNCPKSLVS